MCGNSDCSGGYITVIEECPECKGKEGVPSCDFCNGWGKRETYEPCPNCAEIYKDTNVYYPKEDS